MVNTKIKTSLLLPALLVSTVVEAQNLRQLQGKVVPFSEGGGQGTGGAVEEENFIVGGSNVSPGTLPFYGHFLGTTLCSGVLVHEDIFITAAHCVKDGFPGTIKIGATTTTSENEGQEVNICSGYIHPDNNMKDMKNDLAILKLCDPVFITSYAKWNSNPGFPSATGEDLFIAGFGRTSTTSATSPILQMAKLDYLSSEVCEGRYNKYDPSMNICADAPNAGICYGDSGSPLMTGDNLVVGLASYIVDECASSYPDFFTRLSTYDPWLKEMVCGQALNKPTYCPTTSTGGGGATEDGSGDSGGTSDPLSPLTECLTIFLGFLNGFGRGIMDAIRG